MTRTMSSFTDSYGPLADALNVAQRRYAWLRGRGLNDYLAKSGIQHPTCDGSARRNG